MPKPAYDAALANRQYDKDGRLHILRTRISKACVNPYYGREIPHADTLGLDPNRIYYLLRDQSELKQSAPSFARVPLMFKHIATSADDPHQEAVAGAIGSDVSFETPYLIADISVWDAEAIAGIETDTVRELSSSYHYDADMTPGTFEGTPYDGVMRNISGNHVALVVSGRAGSDVMAADNELEKPMKETKFGKLIYAILCASSPKLAKDAALKPLVIGLRHKTFNVDELKPKLLAMDAEMPQVPTLAAMSVAKDATELDDKQEDDEQGKKNMAKDCGYCGAKDGQAHAEGCKTAADEKAAKDAEAAKMKEEEEKKAKDAKEKEDAAKMAGDAKMKLAMDEFEKKLRSDLKEADEARRAVRSVVGDVLAHDSAADIYGFALDQMKVDRKGVEGVVALRALFNVAAQASKDRAPVRQAFDAAGDMATLFPNASRELRTM